MAWEEFPTFTSSNLAEIRYDGNQMMLEVVFQNGGTYHYYDVESHVIEEFKVADSKGIFLAERIKGHYRYSKA